MIALSRKLIATIWLIALMLSVGAGAIGLFEPADQHLSAARSQVAQKAPSGEIVIVGLDEASLAHYGGWPWPRKTMAGVLDTIDAAKPSQILFDIAFVRNERAKGNDPLEHAASTARAPVYFALLQQKYVYNQHEITDDYRDLYLHGPGEGQVYVGSDLNAFGAPFEVNYGTQVRTSRSDEGNPNSRMIGYVPSLAVVAAHKESLAKQMMAQGDDDFRIAHFIDLDSVTQISLLDISKNSELIAGKTVIVAPTARMLRDVVAIPFHNETAGVFQQVLGAETLLLGEPTYIGWLPALMLVALAMGLYFIKRPVSTSSLLILTGTFIALNIIAGILERQLVFCEIFPALFMCAIYHFMVWRAGIRIQNRDAARRDQQTGLPNLAAHIARLEEIPLVEINERTVVSAIITNAEDAAVLLTDPELNRFYGEIARRIGATGNDMIVHRAAVDMISWDVPAVLGADPEAYAKSIRAMMLVPFQIGTHRIRAEVALGFCEGTDIPATRRLSNAMHAAKRAATEKRLFDKHSERSAAEADWRLAISGDVSDLIEKGEMHLAYQPKFDLKAQKVTGAEALMRWTHAGFGNVPPSDFIPLAEQSSAIVDLTEFAVRKSLEALNEFRKVDPAFVVAVNLSPVLLDDHLLVERLLEVIESEGYEPSAIMFEITEAARISNVARGIGILESMVEKGMSLSIDDYGTGHSTLDYLRIIPAHEVKLDRSFVENLLVSAQDRDLVGSTIDLSHKLGLKVVAEGVENRETIDVLGRLGCDIVQGYCIGRPVPAAEFSQALLTGMKPKVA